MTTARERLISLEDTPYYHCISRCVRRAWLCGDDPYTGKSFEHRRQWVLDRMRTLSGIFAIEICAYAIMSNHYHVVLHVSSDQANAWSDIEVAERWMRLYKGHLLVDRYLAGERMSNAERFAVSDLIETWRKRLFDISWFMRCMNEHLAQRANGEDKCRGRFWEGRFKSQALLDDAALLTCMSYVDLNPVRAGMSETPEDSDFTSIQERILTWKTGSETSKTNLRVFVGSNDAKATSGIPFSLEDYLELVDWTGRSIRDDKKGAIPQSLMPIMQRLGVDPQSWLVSINQYNQHYFSVLGVLDKVREFARVQGKAWCRGQGFCGQTYRLGPA
ncbi:MAG: hypothetical protein ABW095_13225 [Candidatus Thiodiazotropha sp.]